MIILIFQKYVNGQFAQLIPNFVIDTTEYRGIPVPFVKTGWNTG